LKNMVVQDVQNVCVIHDRHRYFASNQ
jgi:hypothetical protein